MYSDYPYDLGDLVRSYHVQDPLSIKGVLSLEKDTHHLHRSSIDFLIALRFPDNLGETFNIKFLDIINLCDTRNGSLFTSTHNSTKLPILDTGKFEQWKFRIQQYLQHEHYALWEVIEFGDSYRAPAQDKSVSGEATPSSRSKGRTVAVTAEDMQKRRNDVKARTTLLLALPDEHQLRFSKYETAKELWEAILRTFGGNEATKKTKKNLLKQQYGNFKAEGSETLEQTFNRLQAIVSQLEFLDVPVEQEDLNQKFLTSLSPEWLMHTIVWRNINDLDTMSLDDLYNHLKVYELEVQKKGGLSSQNMAFISSSNTNSGKIEVLTAQSFSTSSGQVTTATTEIDDDNIEEMDIKWNMALLSMRADRFWKKTGKKITFQGSDVAGFDKSKVECFNCHKLGHFARECRAPRSQDRSRRESYKKEPKVEEPSHKAMMAIDGIR
ncbi:ribonuclease H-like domain-containing protein [Tanacetum coccineum]